MGFEIGNRIFDYEITGVLGAGGMGRVYKVRNVISDRVDAMKILLPDLAQQPELADRFLREIKMLARLSHPNIAAFYTALTFENQLIMVMEYVSGVTLAERLQQGPLPLAQAIRCIDQALAALSYAHREGVVHRDIKPANMMLTADGGLKLMDFGIAKAAADPQLTRTGTTLGSLFYISPEQLSGSPVDARSDLYSLGIAMYETVTGKRPFEGKSEYSLMAAHLNEAPRPPIEMNTALSSALNQVILLALAKDPNERFQSADAFRNALAQAAQGSQDVAAPRPGAATTVTTPIPAAKSAVAAGSGRPALVGAASSRSGSRGLYMLAGAVIAIILIVASAVELPRWFRARAHSQIATPSASASATPSAPAAAQPVAATATEQPAPATAAGPVPSANPAPQTSTTLAQTPPAAQVKRPAVESGSRSSMNHSPSLNAILNSSHEAASAAKPNTAPPPSVAASAGQMTSSPAAPSAADFQSVSDRMDQLSARASAIKGTFSNFQQQVDASGQGLRPDIVAAESRMERYMDQADSAIAAKNPAQARHYQDLAEREIIALEKFFGR